MAGFSCGMQPASRWSSCRCAVLLPCSALPWSGLHKYVASHVFGVKLKMLLCWLCEDPYSPRWEFFNSSLSLACTHCVAPQVADQRAVNCMAMHPFACVLATGGGWHGSCLGCCGSKERIGPAQHA